MEKLYIRLNKQIDANKLIEKIQKILHKNQINNDTIIEICLKNINKEDNSMIPKLEYKNNDELNNEKIY